MPTDPDRPVAVATQDGVTIVTIDRPPVNALGAEVRRALGEQLDAALRDDAIRAVVLTGAGRLFSGGADISEFDHPPPAHVPSLPALIDMVESSDKPVVAALHGVAAGGALELAMGCHYRLAAPGTRIGLPEVHLGLIPGAGGTQRLPRLVGLARAVELIVSGTLVPVETVEQDGLVDGIINDDLVAAAVGLAGRLVDNRMPVRRSRDLPVTPADSAEQAAALEPATRGVASHPGGSEAGRAAVTCIAAAASRSFADGLAIEGDTFAKLVASDQSLAQRHVFFAERAAAKIPDVPADTAVTPIRTAGVVGGGTMGVGIALSFANVGIPVRLVEVSPETLTAAQTAIRHRYASSVAKGRLSQAEMDQRLSNITGSIQLKSVADADIVVEAVFEDLDLKRELFTRLDSVCPPSTVLATNTSTLDVNAIAGATTRPERVLGTHFFSPAHVMRLVEVVRGARTSAETLATVRALTKRLGKVGVFVGVCDGFVGNRMLAAYRRQAIFLVEEGALPQQIDRVLTAFGLPMGPFQMADLAGLDVGWRIRKQQRIRPEPSRRYSVLEDRICELGRFGQKTGAGWYRYESDGRTPTLDPAIERLIDQVSRERGIRRRPIDDAEIIPRCLYPLVNEGARIIEEQLVLRASDIDVIWVAGYGFPRYRGGPMYWAETVRLTEIHDALQELHTRHDGWLEPAPLLTRLARDGGRFRDLDRAAVSI